MNDSNVSNEINIKETQYRIERRRRQRIMIIVLPILLAFLLIGYGYYDGFIYYDINNSEKKAITTLFISILFSISCLFAVTTYLQTGFKTSLSSELEMVLIQEEAERLRQQTDKTSREREQRDNLNNEIDELRQEIEKTKELTANIGQSRRDELVSELREHIIHQSSQSILSEIREEVSNKIKHDIKERTLFEHFESSRQRLTKEIDALGRRGNLNLALGALTTVIGIILLGVSVFSELTTIKDLWSFISHFAPRLTLVLLIELFAYFFLSLYKTSLMEIKYFQNELTNVEAKQISLRAAIAFAESAALTNIVAKIADTERNHILTKYQTTVELEKARIDKDSRAEIGKLLADFFQKKS